MNVKKTEIAIFVLIVLGACIYLYYNYVFSGQLKKMKAYNEQLKSSQLELRVLEQINKTETANKIAGLEDDLKKIDTSIPDSIDVNDLCLKLYYHIKDQGINLNIMEPQETVNNKDYSAQTISINVNGKRDDILGFIKYLQNYPQKLKIDQAILTFTNDTDIDAKFKIKAFYIKQNN